MEDIKLVNLDLVFQQAICEAEKVLANAYAVYSGICVAAALITEDDQIITGVNVENAVFGLTICAERSALFSAISQGQRSFQGIAIVSNQKKTLFPCGACLQSLVEFASRSFIILCVSKDRERITKGRLGDLLPYPC